MNEDKVFLKGYVIGHAADTLGYQGLLVQLENLDVVEIDKNLVHKKIDKLQLTLSYLMWTSYWSVIFYMFFKKDKD